MSDIFAPVTPPGDAQPTRSRRRDSDRRDRQRLRRKRRIRAIVVLLIALLVVGAVAFWAVPRVLELFSGSDDPTEVSDYDGPGQGEVRVQIPDGASGREMGNVLEEANVVATSDAFVEAFQGNPNASLIQPGAYDLREEMSGEGAVLALLDTANRAEVIITIPEGFTTWQVYARIANIAGVTEDEVEEAAGDAEAIGLPDEAEGNPEGWFGPATYRFEPETEVTEILAAMVNQTIARFEERGVDPGDRQEILTIASIVEHEVNLDEYRGQVARVVFNRLEGGGGTNGYLQMDSTTNYGNGRTGGVPTTAENEDPDNEYSTYVYDGLPPTPIGSPGSATIDAVIDPPDGDWVYFVTVDLDTGETKFADNYDDHLGYVQELRDWLAENR